MIEMKNVSFDYVTFEKNPGLKGALKDFFRRKSHKKRAINTLNLTIKDGEVIGLIGPNGAGKTTFAKLLTGIIEATEGNIKIDNINPALHCKSFYQNIGVMFGQKTQLSWNLPPIDTFNMLSAIYELTDKNYKNRLNYLVEVLNLKDIIKIPVRKLSLGQRVKCELLCALIHSPKYLFLDEPTLGLDIETQKNIYDFLLEENRINKTTIIFTSHNLRDIEAISKRLLILVQGHSPGFVKTAMSEKYYTTFKNKVPFKRFASPTEVADLVLFLTSSMADYITGENFIIDGGFSNL